MSTIADGHYRDLSMAQCKRRYWDDGEKVRIVAQTRVPGVSVSQVARRYDVNANLVFAWRRDPRFNPPPVEDAAATFLPVEVVAAPAVIDPLVLEPKGSEAKIEISLPSGHHITVSGAYDADALCRLVRGLG